MKNKYRKNEEKISKNEEKIVVHLLTVISLLYQRLLFKKKHLNK